MPRARSSGKAHWVCVPALRTRFLWDNPKKDQLSEITRLTVYQRNMPILAQNGFTCFFDSQWSEWSRITNPDPELLKGTQPKFKKIQILRLSVDRCYSPITPLPFSLTRIVPESVRWLMTHKKIREAENILKRVAKTNKQAMPEEGLGLPEDQKTAEREAGFMDLFGSRSMTKKTIISWISW